MRHPSVGIVAESQPPSGSAGVGCAHRAQCWGVVLASARALLLTREAVADRLPAGLTGSPGRGTRFALTQQIHTLLAEQPRLVVIGEAQNLNRDCFEYLRHLHDAPETRFGLLFDGGDGCWDVISREPMLRSRIYRPVAFAPLGLDDVLELIPGYHPIYDRVAPTLLELVNGRAAHGRLRSWAAFTKTATELCNSQHPQITKEIALAAIDHIVGYE